MKLWIVNHPYRYRSWRKVQARVLGRRKWHEGFIWAEWHDDKEMPTFPSRPPLSWNVDPLVIGPRMYFDYCRKGIHKTGTNYAPANSLSPGDLILFGCVRSEKILIDTIFPIGAVEHWGVTGLPAWKQVDPLALAVHFHDAAHEKLHPEVHQTVPVAAKSYRGTRLGDDNAMQYAWVPFRESLSSDGPFVLARKGAAYRRLTSLYWDGRDQPLERRMKGSFRVLEVPEVEVLIQEVRQEALQQGFLIATEVRLVPSRLPSDARSRVVGTCANAEPPPQNWRMHAR